MCQKSCTRLCGSANHVTGQSGQVVYQVTHPPVGSTRHWRYQASVNEKTEFQD